MARPAVKDCPILFYDCETGGLIPFTSDIVEVACILTDPTGKTILDQYEARVFPVQPVDAKAAEINGYTAEKWAEDAIPLDEALHHVLMLARDAVICCHNTPFDWSFLEVAMSKRMQRWSGSYHKLDTLALATPLLKAGKIPNLKLTTLTEYFKVPHDNAHRAMADAKACRGVYLKLMEIYAPLFAERDVTITESMTVTAKIG